MILFIIVIIISSSSSVSGSGSGSHINFCIEFHDSSSKEAALVGMALTIDSTAAAAAAAARRFYFHSVLISIQIFIVAEQNCCLWWFSISFSINSYVGSRKWAFIYRVFCLLRLRLVNRGCHRCCLISLTHLLKIRLPGTARIESVMWKCVNDGDRE